MADVNNAATLLGQKLTINEFVAFLNMTTKTVPIVTEKGLMIVSIAICGFANFSSVGMQIGGIGAGGALLLWVLTKCEDPVSPSSPTAHC